MLCLDPHKKSEWPNLKDINLDVRVKFAHHGNYRKFFMQNRLTGNFSLGNTKTSRKKIIQRKNWFSLFILQQLSKKLRTQRFYDIMLRCFVPQFHTDGFLWIRKQGLLMNIEQSLFIECLSNCRQAYKRSTLHQWKEMAPKEKFMNPRKGFIEQSFFIECLSKCRQTYKRSTRH